MTICNVGDHKKYLANHSMLGTHERERGRWERHGMGRNEAFIPVYVGSIHNSIPVLLAGLSRRVPQLTHSTAVNYYGRYHTLLYLPFYLPATAVPLFRERTDYECISEQNQRMAWKRIRRRKKASAAAAVINTHWKYCWWGWWHKPCFNFHSWYHLINIKDCELNRGRRLLLRLLAGGTEWLFVCLC